ncbi:DUF5662 family protein [Amedibacillus dolichus]|uniref:DUF5662 family protein n=1 Tax=Amedibacillus dolichus TaxID=31971 RepID=UPI00242C4074|nr:DUF5662 family protein [Amedibacillus dolichus]
MANIWGHLKTITKHKIAVTKLCFRCGLYKQGLLHDLSKYSWVEFSAGARYYQGNRSPIDREKEVKGYSLGWLHHKGRNKHHWEYWLDNAADGIQPLEMPLNYVIEMYCDRTAASKIYMKDAYHDGSAYEYFMRGYHHILMHPNTKALLEHILIYQRDHGTDQTIAYIRKELLKNK